MKTVGIIGGLGPKTTSEFFLEIVFRCQKKNKINRPSVLMWNIPLEFEVEEDLLERSIGEERYLTHLIKAAKILENGGADFLVIPCNSVHVFIDDVRKSVSIPVLSIVEETVNFLKTKKIKKAGILATPFSLKKKLFEVNLKQAHIEQILPCMSDQIKLGKIINNLVLDKHTDNDRKQLIEIIDKFKNEGVDNLILACTDFQLLISDHSDFVVHDTMKIFADATVDEILGGE